MECAGAGLQGGEDVVVQVECREHDDAHLWVCRGDSTGRLDAVHTWSLVCGIVGILAYWVSVPTMLGGLAATLGYEGWRRGDQVKGRGRAVAGLVLGTLATVAGAAFWRMGV
jgi:hypothetical protein